MGMDTHTLRFKGHFSRWTWVSRYLPP